MVLWYFTIEGGSRKGQGKGDGRERWERNIKPPWEADRKNAPGTGHSHNVLTRSLLELEFPWSLCLPPQRPAGPVSHMFSLCLVVLYRSPFVLKASWHLWIMEALQWVLLNGLPKVIGSLFPLEMMPIPVLGTFWVQLTGYFKLCSFPLFLFPWVVCWPNIWDCF